jgi:hypothetical protein
MSEEKIYVGRGKKSDRFDIVSIDICLTDLPKEHIKKGNNGKSYIKLNVSAKREVDDYGNTHTVTVDTWKPTQGNAPQSKPETKREYAKPTETKTPQGVSASDTDDLPF